jgi:hypothetical protein
MSNKTIETDCHVENRLLGYPGYLLLKLNHLLITKTINLGRVVASRRGVVVFLEIQNRTVSAAETINSHATAIVLHRFTDKMT